MSVEPPRRVLLSASVHPIAALWLLSRITGRDGDPDIRSAAQTFDQHGQQVKARALRDALAQLQTAVLHLQAEDLLPRIGNAEITKSEMASESRSVSTSLDSPTTVTVAHAAEYLRVRPRRVIQFIDDGNGVLKAEHDGRGRPWRVDRQSLRDLKNARDAR